MHDHLRFAHDPRGVPGRFAQSLSADEERALRQVLEAFRRKPV